MTKIKYLFIFKVHNKTSDIKHKPPFNKDGLNAFMKLFVLI